MTIARIDLPDPTYQRAWSVANAAERATLLSTGDPRRGDIIHQLDTTIYYIVVETSIIQPLSGLAAIPINLATQVTGTLADGNLSANVPLKNATNAFTGANSFATNPLNLLIGQIGFPATPNPSSNVNTLDDYKEGSWTPIDSSGAGLTFAVAGGQYTKIGNRVFFTGQAAYPVTASGAIALIGGLPYVNSGGNAPAYIGYHSSFAAPIHFTLYVIGATSSIQIASFGPGVGLTNAQMSSTNTVFGGAYKV